MNSDPLDFLSGFLGLRLYADNINSNLLNKLAFAKLRLKILIILGN